MNNDHWDDLIEDLGASVVKTFPEKGYQADLFEAPGDCWLKEEPEETLKPGDQIASIPDHAKGDLHHQDVEFGFVMQKPGRVGIFCRYWIKGQPGQLRTAANSELTPVAYLVKYQSVNQGVVDATMKRIQEERDARERML